MRNHSLSMSFSWLWEVKGSAPGLSNNLNGLGRQCDQCGGRIAAVTRDEVTWMAFGGNTRDLGSILEETRQDCKWTQRRHEESVTEGGDDVRKACDAIWS
ncbi:hypothetical protein Tco_0839749 [Tanacetum coccineum]|uniref:Uncharacterized protein n=1 Tax=Tanacetum coccineum TaxID=301880 RepID=A0ABQ5AUA1_9ASTR